MSQPVDRPGHFRGHITEYGIREEQSGAVAIGVKVALTEMWNPELVVNDVKGAWEQWDQYDMEADGFLYIIDKRGAVLTRGVEALVKNAGWDGNLQSISESTWQPQPCGFTITEEEYPVNSGKKQIRVAFVNAPEWSPGARSNVGIDRTRELAGKFGAQLRATAANVKRTTSTTPTGKPAAPPNGQHNPRPVNVWTKEQAIVECENAGVTREELGAAIKAAGHTGWDMMRDTPTAKALIEAKIQPALAAPPNQDADIPF